MVLNEVVFLLGMGNKKYGFLRCLFLFLFFVFVDVFWIVFLVSVDFEVILVMVKGLVSVRFY